MQVVIRDILRGTPPACNGLMCELLGPGWSLGGLLADGRVMVVAVALLLCAPLLLIRCTGSKREGAHADCWLCCMQRCTNGSRRERTLLRLRGLAGRWSCWHR